MGSEKIYFAAWSEEDKDFVWRKMTEIADKLDLAETPLGDEIRDIAAYIDRRAKKLPLTNDMAESLAQALYDTWTMQKLEEWSNSADPARAAEDWDETNPDRWETAEHKIREATRVQARRLMSRMARRGLAFRKTR